MTDGDTGSDKDDEERPLTTVESIVEMWSDGNEWNLGIDYGLVLNEIMTRLGDPPKDSAEWILRAKNMHSLICGAVVRKFKKKLGFFFGPIRVAKGRPMKYCLAKTGAEYHDMYMRGYRRFENCATGRAEDRLLLIKKRHSLPEGHTRQKKLLDSAIKKRLDSRI